MVCAVCLTMFSCRSDNEFSNFNPKNFLPLMNHGNLMDFGMELLTDKIALVNCLIIWKMYFTVSKINFNWARIALPTEWIVHKNWTMQVYLVCDLNRTPNCYGKTWRFLCPFFRNLHLRENLARDRFTSTVSTVSNSVQNIFTHLRYCDKQTVATFNNNLVWFTRAIFCVFENLTTFN